MERSPLARITRDGLWMLKRESTVGQFELGMDYAKGDRRAFLTSGAVFAS